MSHGQVSLFIVIGTILVSIVVGIVVITAPEPAAQAPPPKPYSVYSDTLLQECIERITEESIGTVLGTGGYTSADVSGLEPQFAHGAVAFAILRPNEQEEGYIIDERYREPGISVFKNRYGKIKLPPLEGRHSFATAIHTEADNRLHECTFGGQIEYLDITVHIGRESVDTTYGLRSTAVGVPQRMTHRTELPLRQLHAELSATLERAVYIRGTPLSEGFSDTFEATYTAGLLEVEHEPSGHVLRTRVQERFPLIFDATCPIILENPDPDTDPSTQYHTPVCIGSYLNSVTLTAGAAERVISMGTSI